MLLNYCENYLDTRVECDTPSTDGYEINNLLLASDKGFLAYSCIKPPINIDFHFICNIKLSHVIIWPCVGAQKSSGLRISTKYRNKQQYNFLSTEFLSRHHMGIMFYTRNFNESLASLPTNFSRTFINNYHECIDNLRLTILKTENSVPAISKIQIWGYVSSINNLESARKIYNLWQTHHKNYLQDAGSIENQGEDRNASAVAEDSKTLEVPEEFLDPITWSIMVQPVVLPSGKIIDQSTLDNFGKNEALWGRPLSDPFTGVVFNNNYKPIFASTLKLKIDKFLSDNSENPQFKNVPRTLGCTRQTSLPQNYPIDRIKLSETRVNDEKLMKPTMKERKLNHCGELDSRTNLRHKIPIVARYSGTIIGNNPRGKVAKPLIKPKTLRATKDEEMRLEESCNLEANLKDNLESILSNLKRFGDGKEQVGVEKNICNCCTLPVHYKLPCQHIVCRKIVVSDDNKSQCPHCHTSYKSCDIIKVNL